MPNCRYNTVKEREYKIWVCAGKEFNSLEAARKHKKRVNEKYDLARHSITEVTERVLSFVMEREVR